LLELLAQQEVELGVFKNAVQQSQGQSGLQSLQKKAEQLVIDKYGTYTTYR
jgi:hypothetical protein